MTKLMFSDQILRLNNIMVLSKHSLTIFIDTSCLSEHSFIDLNSYQYIRLICMHVFACHLSMHARISWIFAYNVPKCLPKHHAKFGLLWFGMVCCGLDCKAMSERDCQRTWYIICLSRQLWIPASGLNHPTAPFIHTKVGQNVTADNLWVKWIKIDKSESMFSTKFMTVEKYLIPLTKLTLITF